MGDMRKPATQVIALTWLLLLAPLASFADPLPLVAGTQLQALSKTTVKMLKEDLLIELTGNMLKVRATFLFKNNGPRTSLPVGFPCEPTDDEVAGMNCKSALKVAVKDRRTIPPLKTVENYGTCWVWNMEFQADEEVRLDLDYSAPIVNDRYSIPLGGIYFVYYPLRTGANWDGPIGELAIHVRMPVETIVQITPKGYTRTPGLIEWCLKDVEPAEDLFIILDPLSTETYLLHMSKKPADPDKPTREVWLATFAREFLQGLNLRLGMFQQLRELAKVAPKYRRFKLPGMEGSEAVIEKSALIMDQIAQKKII